MNIKITQYIYLNELMSSIISKDAIQRLLKDVRQIIKHPLTDNNIYYIHDDSDILKGYAMIIGPSETPYFGGFYFFEFNYPYDYPFSPPKVKYMTNDGVTRYNPNLYKCGKVCVSILNTWSGDKWSSCQTINSILLTLCSLLNNTPFLNEPGQHQFSRDYIAYQKSIEFCNINFVICDLIDVSKNLIPEQFKVFYPFMKESFNKNYDQLLSFVTSKNDIVEDLTVSLYIMHTRVDYNKLKNKLVSTKTTVDTQNNITL
jgi:ubiquitin-protein ligase